jgi:hypothetical protein
MSRTDTEGATAAAIYFIALYPYVYGSGDLADWKAMSGPNCRFCASVSKDVVKMREKGRRSEGGQIIVTGKRAYPQEAATGIFPVDLELTQDASRDISAEGGIVDSTSGGETLAQIDLVWLDGRWVINGANTRGKAAR